MNLLFVYTNVNGFHEDIYSFGLASIVSVAREAGHTTRILIVRNKDEYSGVLGEVASFRPRVVGFTAVSSQFAFVKELAAAIKSQFPDVITVCGGVHPTINPECLLEADALDGVFVGESELAFRDFLAAVEAGRPYLDTDNFGHVDNGNLVVNKLRPLIHDLDILPYPDRELYPFADSIDKIGYVPFLFSRGCPYLCSYCSNHALARVYNLPRNHPRYRSVESSIREIEQTMQMLPVRRVLVVDDIFGVDKEWRRDFCREYAKRIARPLMCLLRANVVDDEFMRLLKDADCYQICIGIESGNDHVRNDIMDRRMSREQIVRAFALANKYGIRTNAINMIGLPGETDEMIWDTIRLNRQVKPTISGVNIFYPYRGTKLGDHCFEQNLVDEEKYRSFSNERRESVLKFPEEYGAKLSHYQQNWEALVYPFNVRKRLEKLLIGTFVWKWLRAVKRFIFREKPCVSKTAAGRRPEGEEQDGEGEGGGTPHSGSRQG